MFVYFFQLCASLQMNPGFYLTIKTIILKVSTRRMKGILVLVYLKPCPGSRRYVQGPVSQKSQNFSGLIRLSQFLFSVLLVFRTLKACSKISFSKQPDCSLTAGARFSKVPKLFGRISGYIILFVSSERRRLGTRNFAFILIFIPFTTYEKTGFPELACRSFTNGFSGPKSFPDFRETGP